MDVAAYLHRLGLPADALAPSAALLVRLHRAHTASVPFENLDVALGRPLSLAPEDLFAKLVTGRRGGYCFELNGLFAWLLGELGFAVTHLAARVQVGYEELRPRTHHMMLVEVEGQRFLADVGFGDGLSGPLAFRPGEQADGAEVYRLARDPELGHALERRELEGWKRLYVFSMEPQLPADYRLMNYYTETSPESFFTREVIVTRPTEAGRLTLFGRELRGRGEPTAIADAADYLATLKAEFGIELDQAPPKLFGGSP